VLHQRTVLRLASLLALHCPPGLEVVVAPFGVRHGRDYLERGHVAGTATFTVDQPFRVVLRPAALAEPPG
jgi:hypothetical protein